MTDHPTTTARKHFWISNTAFARATGIKKVCMDCGQPSNNADKVCPGKRAAS
jgi:hypothetical protein